MKKLLNHKNKMFLARFNNSNKSINKVNLESNNFGLKNILKLFNSKKSFMLILKKYNSSFGLVYNFYYNHQLKSYGSNYSQQNVTMGNAIHLLFEKVINYNPDFFIVKSKKDLNDFNNLVKRTNLLKRK